MKQGPPQNLPIQTSEIIDIKGKEHISNPYLRMLKQSIEGKDTEALREVTGAIQRQVHRMPTLPISPMQDSELKELIDTGEGMIIVGTGTLGERIYIKKGEIFMPQQPDQESSRKFYDNFRYVFELADGQELRVKF